MAESHTPGPWRECGHNRGGCVCGIIWSVTDDHPVAYTINGPWGDEYPSLRFVKDSGGEGSISPKIEAYIEMMEYGSVSESEAKANARLIAAAPEMLEALKLAQQIIGHPDDSGSKIIAAAIAKATAITAA